MALTGQELVRLVGVINHAPAAAAEYTTTQNVANLANGAPSPLNGGEVLYVYGPSGSSIPSAVPFRTTTGAINALGSIAASTLAGTELVELEPAVIGQSQAAVARTYTALQVANS